MPGRVRSREFKLLVCHQIINGEKRSAQIGLEHSLEHSLEQSMRPSAAPATFQTASKTYVIGCRRRESSCESRKVPCWR